MILRARAVVTMDGPAIADGAVAIEDSRIVDVGSWSEVRRRQSGPSSDLGERVLLPGLINAHCHLEYTCLKGAMPKGGSFTDWVQRIVTLKEKLTPEDVRNSLAMGLAEAQRFGTTTIANIESFREPMPETALRLLRFPELIDLGRRDIARPETDYLSPHAIYTASAELYRRCKARARLITTHLAESADEMAMFRDARGALFDFLAGIGRPMNDCGVRTPVAHFLECCAATENYVVAHLNEIADSDWALLEKGPRFAIVHCPRSHAYFRHRAFCFEKLHALGFTICLGTDSLASNADLSLFAEMREFRDRFPQVPSRDVLAMVTSNAAAALGQPNDVGRIRAGFKADLIALPLAGPHGNLENEIIGFERAVSWMMIDGRQVVIPS